MQQPLCIPLNPKWGQSWYPHEVSTFSGPITHSHLPLPTTIYQYDLNADVPTWQDFANAAVQHLRNGKDTFTFTGDGTIYRIIVTPKLKKFLARHARNTHNDLNAFLHTKTQGIYNQLSTQFDETQDTQFRDAWMTWMHRVGFDVQRVHPNAMTPSFTQKTPSRDSYHMAGIALMVLGIVVLLYLLLMA